MVHENNIVVLAKMVLPGRMYRPARTYAVRLRTWLRLLQHVRGGNVRDKMWLYLSFLASPFTAIGSLREWRDPILLKDIMTNVPGIGHFALRAHTDDLWHVVPFRESAVLECIRTMLRPGDCFVDAGANIGFYTIVAARSVGNIGRVVAIEMAKETADILRNHIKLNNAGCARVVEAALSASEDQVLLASMQPGRYGQASINSAEGGAKTFEVRTATLNSILREIASVRLLKLDIEGAELEALKGGVDVLNRVDAIIFEHLERKGLKEDITAFLSSRGFRIERLDNSNSFALRSD